MTTRQRKKVKKGRKDPNFLPGHICQGFETELVRLVDALAQSQDPKALYLQSEYKSKYLDEKVTPADVRRKAALAKWLAAEDNNRKTNQRLILEQEVKDFGWVTSTVLLNKASEIIRDVLGDVERFSLDNGAHSNGASTRIRRSPKAAILKHAGEANVSSSAVKHWILDSAKESILQKQSLCIHESSTFFTVPKSTDIDRVACKEPEVNMFMQREVGKFIRTRLKRVGIDLRDQTRNQQLAGRAYSTNLATIDLSSASDSITTTLVWRLLPYGWFALLDDLRVKTVDIDGRQHELAMFSSMGNGFTFELESLIFYALTRAICWRSGVRGEVSVYGDDIIVSCDVARRLARVFSWLGFKVNPKKSNWSGPLRESCGKHFHKNREITPFYLRRPIGCKTDVIRVLNRLLQWSSEGTGVILDTSVLLFHRKWAKIIPDSLAGGNDPELDTCLVDDRPYGGCLRRQEIPLDYEHETALIWWLTTKRSSFSELESDPSEVTKYTIDPYSEYHHVSVWDSAKGRHVRRKVHKTGWQRPTLERSPYSMESDLLRPDIRVPSGSCVPDRRR